MQRQHDAVADEAHVERRARSRVRSRSDAERQRGDRRAAQHDRDRRQREPLAEQAGEAEQQHGGVQRDQRGGVRHAASRGERVIDPRMVPSRRC